MAHSGDGPIRNRPRVAQFRGGIGVPVLGKTKLEVSQLCFGTLALSPLQGCKDVERGVEVLRYGLERGINFLDTAEIYVNYDIIRRALKGIPGETVIATKCYAYSREQMALSLEKARREMDRDVIEIFMLHEQESMHTLRGHKEALDYLVEAKQRGVVRAVGISTHAIGGVRAAAALPEIDVIHPIVNKQGLGIIDGTLADMLTAVEFAFQMGKGLYGMKALGGGHLCADPVQALDFARKVPGLSAVAVGMASCLEVDVNLGIFAGLELPREWMDRLQKEQRVLHVAEWCQGCGKCVAECSHGALYVSGNRAFVEREKCVLCGYCGAACPHFCLKIIRQGE